MTDKLLTQDLEEQYLRDIYFERIGNNFQRISGDLGKLIETLNNSTTESEVQSA